MDVVLVGLPGSGKSVVGRRLAAREAAAFVDLDAEIERAAGTTVAEIFAAEGEAGFRARERSAIEHLGDPGASPDGLERVIAAGGGALVDPRSRWRLVRGRRVAWLDVRPEVAAQRLRNSRHVRPLLTTGDPTGALRRLASDRERFYAAATVRVRSVADRAEVTAALSDALRAAPATTGTTLLRADTSIGRFLVGDGIAAEALEASLEELGARRAILVSEPGAWAAAGERLAEWLGARGREVATVMLPRGEAAKRLSVVETAARELASLHAERGDPLVAIGGGALGDATGLLAALWLRGVRLIHVPTTLVAQIDSAIGGKTAVDLPEGKNLVGAFHQPSAVIVDVSVLRTLAERERRAALGEAVKMAALGDERLFALLEAEGEMIAAGDDAAWSSGAVAELVERCLWAKVGTVLADERETLDGAEGADGPIGRIALNLGHTVGHGLEAATGFERLLHGEAVGYGLRAACRIGVELGVTPPERAARIEALLDALALAVDPLAVDRSAVAAAMGTDKKHAGGRLRWLIPTADGVVVRSDVDGTAVLRAIDTVLAGRTVTFEPVAAGGSVGSGGRTR